MPTVVNVVDVTLSRNAGRGGVDVAEGNGSGVVWDDAGHIVTNYHVLASVLRGLGGRQPSPPPVVALVTALSATGGVSSTYNAYLVGADRSRDICVIRVDAPRGALRPATRGAEDVRVGQQARRRPRVGDAASLLPRPTPRLPSPPLRVCPTGARPGQPVWVRPLAVGGHHQRRGTGHRKRSRGRVHPRRDSDGRRGQPGQQWRRPARRDGSPDRHQHGHLYADGDEASRCRDTAQPRRPRPLLSPP